MMLGATTKKLTGAVGDARGVVQNVAPIQDREVIFDGSGESYKAPTTDWAVLSDDTLNLTTHANHVLGRHSLEFDKVDGAGNTVYAGVVNDSLDLDLSRFQGTDRVEALFFLSALADVESVILRLGTDAGNYNEWEVADTALVSDVWQELSFKLEECAIPVTGDGWDPANVKYAAFIVKFDAQDDTLANIRLDHIVMKSTQGAEDPVNGNSSILWDSLTAAGTFTTTKDVKAWKNHTISYDVTLDTRTSMVLIVWGRIANGVWLPLATITVTAAGPVEDGVYFPNLPLDKLRCELDTETGGAGGSVIFGYKGGN